MRVHTVLAPNPGPFTGPGTNSYVVAADGQALVLDPGPLIPQHLDALRTALAGFAAVGVAVTHTHPDHAPAANPLAEELGVPAYGAAAGPGFVPTRVLGDGAAVAVGRTEVEAIATPGHTADHLCFAAGPVLFSGDHILGGTTTVIDDLAAYLDSLRRLAGLAIDVIYPGHGEPIEDPPAAIAEYLAHRLERERQILAALDVGAVTVGEVVEMVYVDLDPALRPAAAQSVGAHLRKLAAEGRVVFGGGTGWDSAVGPAGR